MESQSTADALITYWQDGPNAVDDATRRLCREVVAVLARSMSGLELLALQDSPEEHRREIEAHVALWLARTATGDKVVTPVYPTRDLAATRPPRPANTAPSALIRPNPEASVPPVCVPAPARSSQPEPGVVQFHQASHSGINLGNAGTIQGGLNLTMPALATAPTPDPQQGARLSRGAVEPAEDQKVRILFLGANPVDSSPLRLDEEVRAIDRALTSATLGNRCELAQKWAVRVDELQGHLLRTKPQVVHFSGHGSRNRSIVLQGDDGLSRPVAADRLARLLARFHPRLRCVVLNACYTKEHGEAIAEHIDCVVGMSTAVADRAAICFSAAFYRAVASGCSVQDAFDLAQADIELGEMEQDEVPTLLSRRCRASEVFLVQET